MDIECHHKNIKQKMSVAIEAGFSCSACGVQTITYDGSVAAACLNCGAADPKMVWKDIIKHTMTVETVKL